MEILIVILILVAITYSWMKPIALLVSDIVTGVFENFCDLFKGIHPGMLYIYGVIIWALILF